MIDERLTYVTEEYKSFVRGDGTFSKSKPLTTL